MASDRIWGDPRRAIVILDTSAVLMLFEYNIDLQNELDRLLGAYSVLIPFAVVKEIRVLSEKASGKQKRNAKAALSLIDRYETKEMGSGSSVDDVIISAAIDYDAVVVTNDKELRIRLKKKSLPTIFLRGKNHLVLD